MLEQYLAEEQCSLLSKIAYLQYMAKEETAYTKKQEELICDLVEQGNGISVLPDYVTDRGVQEGGLAYLNVCDLHIQVWKQLLYHKDKWISPQMKSVLAFCMEREFHEKEG